MKTNLVQPSCESDVAEEAQFETLNRHGFVRADSAEHQWYLLVNEACVRSGIPVDPIVPEYLGTMLNRFMTRTELFEQFSAFSFFEHLLGVESIEELCIQDAADISLQYVAYFERRSLSRHEPRSVAHIADIGVSLYHELARSSEKKDDWFSHAFPVMEHAFGSAVMILRLTNPDIAPHATMLERGWKSDAILFPDDAEAARLAKSLERFSQMYFRGEGKVHSA